MLGISIVNAGTDTQIAPLGNYYRQLNKKVYAVFDKQEQSVSDEIFKAVDYAYEATEHGIENVVLKGIKYSVLLKYGEQLVNDDMWPSHLMEQAPNSTMNEEELRKALLKYFTWRKGDGSLANLVVFCDEGDMPAFIKDTVYGISGTLHSSSMPLTEEDENSIDTECLCEAE